MAILRPVCSGCGKKGPGYDRLLARRFEFVPLWNMAVFFVCARRRVDCPTCGIEAIGVDEIQWRRGRTHLTLVYQISGVTRLLRVSHERTEQSLRRFFDLLPDDVRKGIRFACSDMRKPNLNVIAEQIPPRPANALDRVRLSDRELPQNRVVARPR